MAPSSITCRGSVSRQCATRTFSIQLTTISGGDITRRIRSIDGLIAKLQQQKEKLSNSWLPPNEVLLTIFEQMPDLASLHSLVVSSPHFYGLFRAHRKRIQATVLVNDIGWDVLFDYVDLNSLDAFDGLRLEELDAEKIDVSIASAISRRKSWNKEGSLRELWHDDESLWQRKLGYIAQQANLIRRCLDTLLDKVLFGPKVDGRPCSGEKLLHHEFLENCPATQKRDPKFNLDSVKCLLDAAEKARFKRGLHRIHICRMLLSGGWAHRAQAAEDGVYLGLHYLSRAPRAGPRNATRSSEQAKGATNGRDDSLRWGLNPSKHLPALYTYMLSLPPWHKEEIACCGKLLARGYAQASRLSRCASAHVTIQRAHDMSLLHLSSYLRLLNPSQSWNPGWNDMARNGSIEQDMSRHLWDLLQELPTAQLRQPSLEAHFWPGNEVPAQASLPTDVTRHTYGNVVYTIGNKSGPWADRFDEDAPPLYRAIVNMCGERKKSTPSQRLPVTIPSEIRVSEWLADCWPMWSHARRVRSWPRFRRLEPFLRETDPAVHDESWKWKTS